MTAKNPFSGRTLRGLLVLLLVAGLAGPASAAAKKGKKGAKKPVADAAAPGAAAAAGPAAIGDKKKAKKLYADADKAYMLTKYGEAAELYKAAYEAYPEPAFLFNVAQSYRLGGEPTLAVRFYKNYLVVAPDAPNVKKVRRLIAKLEAKIAAVGPPVDDGAGSTEGGAGDGTTDGVTDAAVGSGDSTPVGDGDTSSDPTSGDGGAEPTASGDGTGSAPLGPTGADAVAATPAVRPPEGRYPLQPVKIIIWSSVAVALVGGGAVLAAVLLRD